MDYKERKEMNALCKKLTGNTSSWQTTLKRGILVDIKNDPSVQVYFKSERKAHHRPIKVSKRYWPTVEEVKQKMIDELTEKETKK